VVTGKKVLLPYNRGEGYVVKPPRRIKFFKPEKVASSCYYTVYGFNLEQVVAGLPCIKYTYSIAINIILNMI
jgi:hypothetical protein